MQHFPSPSRPTPYPHRPPVPLPGTRPAPGADAGTRRSDPAPHPGGDPHHRGGGAPHAPGPPGGASPAGPGRAADEVSTEVTATAPARAADLTVTKIMAGAGAAATSAVLGSFYGAAGTVAGAAIGSVASTVSAVVYQRSLERTRETIVARIRVPRDGRADTADGATRPVPAGSTGEETVVLPAPGGGPSRVAPAVPQRPRPRWGLVVVGTLLVFVIGLLAVTGLEWAKGSTLTNGETGTSVGRVLDPAPVEPAPTEDGDVSTTDTTDTTEPTPSSTPTPSGTPGEDAESAPEQEPDVTQQPSGQQEEPAPGPTPSQAPDPAG